MLPTARASRDAAMLQEKTKQPFRNSSVLTVRRLQAGRRRYRGSIVGRGICHFLKGPEPFLGINGYQEVTGDRGSTVIKALCYKSEGR